MNIKPLFLLLFLFMGFPNFSFANEINIDHWYRNKGNVSSITFGGATNSAKTYANFYTDNVVKFRTPLSYIPTFIRRNPYTVATSTLLTIGLSFVEGEFFHAKPGYTPNYYWYVQGATSRKFASPGDLASWYANNHATYQGSSVFEVDYPDENHVDITFYWYVDGNITHTQGLSAIRFPCSGGCLDNSYYEPSDSDPLTDNEVIDAIANQIADLMGQPLADQPQEIDDIADNSQPYAPIDPFKVYEAAQPVADYYSPPTGWQKNPSNGSPTNPEPVPTDDYLENPTDPDGTTAEDPPLSGIEQPLTYEQLLERDIARDNTDISEADNYEPDQDFDELPEDFTTIMDFDLPAITSKVIDWANFSQTCVGFNISLGYLETLKSSAMSSVLVDDHCSTYDSIIRPILNWALYILAGLHMYGRLMREI